MNYYINKWYKNHSLIYKILLFIATTLLIVYLFPKSGKFKYNFDKGKPWLSENLYAPFNFAIEKSPEELKVEKESISKNSPAYFDLSPQIQAAVFKDYEAKFKNVFRTDSVLKNKNDINKLGRKILEDIYKFGVTDENYEYPQDKSVIILEKQVQKRSTVYSNLMRLDNFRPYIEQQLEDQNYAFYKATFVSLFFDIIKPNLKLNKTLTNNDLEEQFKTISAVRGSVEKGTLIISKGEIVGGHEFDVLRSLENEFESQVWTASNYYLVVGSYTLLVAMTLLMLLLFLRKYRPIVFSNNTKVTFIFFNISLMVLLTTIVMKYNSEFVYVVPLCMLPLILKAFFDSRLGLFTHVLTVLLLGLIVPNSYEYMFLQITAGIVTILTVSELYKRANLFISVGQITFVYILAYFAFFVIQEGSISTLQFENFGLFILCGLATLFVQPMIYIYERLFGLVSDVSLLELSDTNSKLLKELSNKAPGTFHHSLNVANLAEYCANEVGANAMLVRVGALYHDIGKMKNPTYFTENQVTGINPHDELSPKESTEIILNHVIDGIEIAKKNNLPDRVIDFIRTHHGTSLVYYFYRKEKELEQSISETDFRYSGPRPFSKETAILMICDSVEAASKSLREPTSMVIDSFVEQIINKQMDDGQFLNADITFKEIESIKKILKNKLANIFHIRVEYPE